jgi:hypothetical protein
MATVTRIYQNWLKPLAAINARILIGFGVLALVMAGQSAMIFLRPLD